MSQDRPHLSDEEIDDRLRQLEQEAFPEEDTQRLAEELAHLCWGPRAEGALNRVVEELPPARLIRLVSRHVMARPDSYEPQDYCGEAAEEVAEKLWDLGLPLRGDGQGWTVALPDRTEITRRFGPASGSTDTQGEAVCRAALLGVWLRTMRKRQAAAQEG